MHGKTVGIMGTGKIGQVLAKIMSGFGCRILAYDVVEHEACVQVGASYVSLDTLLRESDIISFHVPLTPETYHLVDEERLKLMKKGVMLINTGRGGLIDSVALVDALKSGHVGAVGLDVYEEEGDLFFRDLSGKVLQDDTFARLLTFPNVLISGHQAFFTREALADIASATLKNIDDFQAGRTNGNVLKASEVMR